METYVEDEGYVSIELKAEEPDVAEELDSEIENFEQLVKDTMSGKLGRGDKRKAALGDNYSDVMAEVKRRRLQNGNV